MLTKDPILNYKFDLKWYNQNTILGVTRNIVQIHESCREVKKRKLRSEREKIIGPYCSTARLFNILKF